MPDLGTARWLASADAADALALARQAADGRDQLAAASWLRRRRPDLDPARAAALLEQAELAEVAARRYGVGRSLLLTRDGLEQATRPEIAARRAAAFAAAGARRVVDLTAGLGFDTRAFLVAGLEVVAVERDPVTAVLLAANAPGATVLVDDALNALPTLLADLSPHDIVFVDPARRDPTGPRDRATGRARPERDPARWSPPWPAIETIAHPRVAAKVAPAFEPPARWQGQWTSWQRTLVEAQVASWPLAQAERRAVVLGPGVEVVIDADPTAAAVLLTDDEPLPAFLYEPDPAVARAGAVAAVAAVHGLRGLDAHSSWLAGDEPAYATPALRGFRVVTELTGSTRDRRRALRDLGIERVVVKSRDVSIDPATVRRDLGVAEGGDHVLVLTRRAGRMVTYLALPRGTFG